jgi:hypothetical protein
MTSTDRNPWHDRALETEAKLRVFRDEVERTGTELVVIKDRLAMLREGVRALLVWHNDPRTQWRHDYPAGEIAELSRLMEGDE